MKNPKTRKLNEEIFLLQNKKAGFLLKCKKWFQFLVHYSFDMPMSLIEHFPLEHVFLSEFKSIKKEGNIKRYKQVLEDFNRPENENYASMVRLVDNLFLSDVKLEEEDSYFFSKKNKPSCIFLLFCLLGILCLSLLMLVYVPSTGDVDTIFYTIQKWYNNSFFIVLGLAGCMCIGLYLIPRMYNPLIKKSFNLSLFANIEDNLTFLNTAKFVKNRKESGYYCSLVGFALVLSLALFHEVGFSSNIYRIILALSIIFIVVPLAFGLNIFVLYSPIFTCLKYKTIKVDLYSVDFQGGLKYYHRLLFYTFLCNEGLVCFVFSLLHQLNAPQYYYLIGIILLIIRLNHAGASIILFCKSLLEFHRVKNKELEMLEDIEGIDTMSKMEQLKKVHPIHIPSFVFNTITTVIIPYLISQIPAIPELFLWLKTFFK